MMKIHVCHGIINITLDAWNKEQDLNTAMQNSVNWYFERISDQIPKNYTATQLKQLNYGNKIWEVIKAIGWKIV